MCSLDEECLSFFYNPINGMCTGHAIQFYTSALGRPDEGAMYFTRHIDIRDCADILEQIPGSPSEVYNINPLDGKGHFNVYCDMTTDGGGWTVFQRRQDGSVDFLRNWTDYKIGFGTVEGEFWLDIRDCADILEQIPGSPSEVYNINPLDGKGHFNVYCDMTTDGGGWTVFQRRQDGSVDFLRNWTDYKIGFGTVEGEFWLGNDNINRLTKARPVQLRIDLKGHDDLSAYAIYSSFQVENETSNYRLNVSRYSGDAGNSLRYHSGFKFTTIDRDNDAREEFNCAERMTGAWWYKACLLSNLNGLYNVTKFAKGVILNSWRGIYYPMKWTEMKLKPR